MWLSPTIAPDLSIRMTCAQQVVYTFLKVWGNCGPSPPVLPRFAGYVVRTDFVLPEKAWRHAKTCPQTPPRSRQKPSIHSLLQLPTHDWRECRSPPQPAQS